MGPALFRPLDSMCPLLPSCGCLWLLGPLTFNPVTGIATLCKWQMWATPQQHLRPSSAIFGDICITYRYRSHATLSKGTLANEHDIPQTLLVPSHSQHPPEREGTLKDLAGKGIWTDRAVSVVESQTARQHARQGSWSSEGCYQPLPFQVRTSAIRASARGSKCRPPVSERRSP